MASENKQPEGFITHIQRFAINDGPGIRTTVFFKGCPLNCRWCHNPECISSQTEIFFHPGKCERCGRCAQICPERVIDLDRSSEMRIERSSCTLCMACVEACPYSALTQVGEFNTPEEVLEEVERDVPFYRNSGGGMTLSGGEPLSQPEFAGHLIRKAKANGIHTAVDTCGYLPFDSFEHFLAGVDLILYDIKLIDSERHRAGTGAGNNMILENCTKLAAMKVPMRIRIPLIPNFNDSDDDMQSIADFTSAQGLHDVDLLPYHMYASSKYEKLGQGYEFEAVEPLTDDRVTEIDQLFVRKGLNVTIGG